MTTMRRFSPGEVVLHRMPFIDESGASGPPAITDIRPVVVAEDIDERIALWLPAGTQTVRCVPVTPRSRKPWRPGEWRLETSTWDRFSALFVIRPGAWRADWVCWWPDGGFRGWYVNLQEPIVRTPLGFDVRDLQLDIVVDAERQWRWKDEDELDRSVEAGVISPAVAERTRAAAAEAVAAIESGDPPFGDEWRTWRPDPAWPAPGLPEDMAGAYALHRPDYG